MAQSGIKVASITGRVYDLPQAEAKWNGMCFDTATAADIATATATIIATVIATATATATAATATATATATAITTATALATATAPRTRFWYSSSACWSRGRRCHGSMEI